MKKETDFTLPKEYLQRADEKILSDSKELKKEAEAEADKVIIGSGMDRASVIHLKHLLVTMYIQGATEATKELKAQIEKLIDFVLSKTECCDVCPITDTCINSEGTCPYAGILAKGEEEVTREWLMQKIAKENKQK